MFSTEMRIRLVSTWMTFIQFLPLTNHNDDKKNSENWSPLILKVEEGSGLPEKQESDSWKYIILF